MKLESDTGEATMYVSSKGGVIEKITKLKKSPYSRSESDIYEEKPISMRTETRDTI